MGEHPYGPGKFMFEPGVVSRRLGTDADCKVYSWPWPWFAQEEGDRPFFISSKGCIPVKNTASWTAVVFFCVSENSYFV